MSCRLFPSLCTKVTFCFQTTAATHPYLAGQSFLTLSKVWVPTDTPGTLRTRVPTTVGMARAMGSSEWTQSSLCEHPRTPVGLCTQAFQMGKGAW